ncbi:MAG: methionine synthase [Bacteroidales bacterium]
MATKPTIQSILEDRILVLDGAMGTMIQQYKLSEEDYRGTLVSGNRTYKGNNDMLCITKPEVIREIHAKYLMAGADIIETNTFNANSVSMEDYGMQSYVREMNLAATRLALEVAAEFTAKDPSTPRYVAGAIGPTNKTCSMSPDVNNPAYRALTFDALCDSYQEQIEALIEGGVDLLLIETIFDSLNAKVALFAAEKAMKKLEKKVPIMLSVTLSDKGGRTLSGQTMGAFLASVEHADILSVGLNCSFGARDMKPFIKELGEISPYYISAYPNAGLPNRFGEYDESPEIMALQIKEYFEESLVNVIGGCCGTTPDHIATYKSMLQGMTPHAKSAPTKAMRLSGLELLDVKPENNFVNIGERCNVAGSRKFLRLIREENYEEALTIARKQVEDGAQILDVNMDEGMLDAVKEMTTFLNLMMSEPDICCVPIMIDSSKWHVIEEGLKCVQGKCVVNSISLKEGEAQFLEQARLLKSYGAAAVVMAFDEQGQADTFPRRVEICTRAYNLLVNEVKFNPNDIIFDPNVLALATGIEEHATYGIDFLKATEWIKQTLPGAKVSGGLSNLSFSFRGNNYIREAMHSVFLYHAIKVGMDMAIVNPSEAVLYDDIPANVLEAIEDVIFNRRADATERLLDIAEQLKNTSTGEKQVQQDEWRSLPLEDRLIHALQKGIGDHMAEDIAEALTVYAKAVDIIDEPLMKGMNKVGELFGEGKMFLPQVVKTARTMKKAVAILQPVLEAEKVSGTSKAGTVLIATVKGDVHDIGKNIVGVVLSCNNYEMVDLGVMVHLEEIIKKAKEIQPDFIGLSGLITPSLDEMTRVAQAMEAEGFKMPLLIGGATTSKIHTAVKIAPHYTGAPVIHSKDASQTPGKLAQWLNLDTRADYVAKLESEYETLRLSIQKEKPMAPYSEAKERALKLDFSNYTPAKPNNMGTHRIDIPVKELVPYIHWIFFFSSWRLGGKFAKIAELDGCDSCRLAWVNSFPVEDRPKAEEALKLYRDAERVLDRLIADEACVSAVYGHYEASSDDRTIYINSEKGEVKVPVLRQQEKADSDNPYYSLADFIAPKTSGVTDYIGCFGVTAGGKIEGLMKEYEKAEDDFMVMLVSFLSDRLAEAGTENLHEKIRKEFWGYAADENLSIDEMLKVRFRGIRPAVGYPSLPDQSVNFILNDIVNLSSAGITLTENGAMSPAASVSGFFFAHPQSDYFMIGKVGEEQLMMYAKETDRSLEEVKRWIRN